MCKHDSGCVTELKKSRADGRPLSACQRWRRNRNDKPRPQKRRTKPRRERKAAKRYGQTAAAAAASAGGACRDADLSSISVRPGRRLARSMARSRRLITSHDAPVKLTPTTSSHDTARLEISRLHAASSSLRIVRHHTAGAAARHATTARGGGGSKSVRQRG